MRRENADGDRAPHLYHLCHGTDDSYTDHDYNHNTYDNNNDNNHGNIKTTDYHSNYDHNYDRNYNQSAVSGYCHRVDI